MAVTRGVGGMRDSQLPPSIGLQEDLTSVVSFVLILLVDRFGHGQSSIEIRKERKLHVSSMLDRGRAASVDRPEDDHSTGWSSRVLSAVVWMPIRTVHIRVSVRFGIHLGSNW